MNSAIKQMIYEFILILLPITIFANDKYFSKFMEEPKNFPVNMKKGYLHESDFYPELGVGDFVNFAKKISDEIKANTFNSFIDQPEVGRIRMLLRKCIIDKKLIFCPKDCFSLSSSADEKDKLYDRCSRIEHALPQTCSLISLSTVDLNMFRVKQLTSNNTDEYEKQLLVPAFICQCEQGYVFDHFTKTCNVLEISESSPIYGACDVKTKFPCSTLGTKRCTSKKVSMANPDKTDLTSKIIYVDQAKCECEYGFFGKFCEVPLDTCRMYTLKDRHGKLVRGNDLCNVKMNGVHLDRMTETEVLINVNKCEPLLGTARYTCKCNGQNSIRIMNEDGFEKCEVKETLFKDRLGCTKENCIHGACHRTFKENGIEIEGKDYFCLCDSNWDGLNCNERVEQWSTWSSCKPECGAEKRKRSRSRKIYDREKLLLGQEEKITLVQEQECIPKKECSDSDSQTSYYDSDWDLFRTPILAVCTLGLTCIIFTRTIGFYR